MKVFMRTDLSPKKLRLEIRKNVPKNGTYRCDVRASFFIFAFYACYFLMVNEFVHPVLFIISGVIMFIRYFVAYHTHFHADRNIGKKSMICTYLPVIVGPLQLGYPEYRKNHFAHHRLEGAKGDPDLFITGNDSALVGAFHAFFEPEQALVRYIKVNGFGAEVFLRSVLYFTFFCLLAAYGGDKFVWYLLASRIGSFFSWFLFAWYLHHGDRFEAHRKIGMPASLAWIYANLFGHDCLNTTLYHYTHHQYDFVPSENLSEAVTILRRLSSE